MSAALDWTARIVRALPLPQRLRSPIWNMISGWNSGKSYIIPVEWQGKRRLFGGVCGYSHSSLFQNLRDYEPESVKAVSRLLHDVTRPVVLDVGAHNGEWIFLLKTIREDAVIHAFEPFPALAAHLERLKVRSGWEDIRVVPVLLGRDHGEGSLHFKPGVTECASTVEGFQANFSQKINVPRETLDAYVEREGISRIALIKIDVEGGELEVLEGARRTLERLQPPLLLELLFTQNPDHLKRQHETVALLRRLGYSFFLVQKDGRLTYQDIVEPDNGYKALNFLVTRRGAEGGRA